MSASENLLALCQEMHSAAETEAWEKVALSLQAQDLLLREAPHFSAADRQALEAAIAELNAALQATRERRDQVEKLLRAFGAPPDQP